MTARVTGDDLIKQIDEAIEPHKLLSGSRTLALLRAARWELVWLRFAAGYPSPEIPEPSSSSKKVKDVLYYLKLLMDDADEFDGAILGMAIAEIQRLRGPSGEGSNGPSFEDMKMVTKAALDGDHVRLAGFATLDSAYGDDPK